MTLLETAPAAADSPRIGRDELNLAEFPFAVLASRVSKKNSSVLEFKDGEKEWVVSGDPRYGLPTAGDVEVYVVLMELTREQSFPKTVQFCRHDVIRRLGWDSGGQSYDRFLLSLDRLVGVTIRTTNAFWDASQRSWIRRHAFHVLESYDITDSRHARPDELSLFPSWIRWSPELYQNMQSGYIKALDVDLFLSLKSSVSQALYRYLDAKRYDGKPIYRIGLKKLAFEHLGLSRNYFPSDVKRKLKVAHDELTEAGFLLGVEYAPMKSGEDMAIYRFAPRTAREPRAAKVAELPPPNPLIPRLIEHGVSRKTAQELADKAPEECERQLSYLRYRDCRDRGAVLVAAIRDGWAAPPEWEQAQQREKRKATPTKATAPEPEAPQRPSEETDFDAWWAELPAERRDAATEQAIAWLREENRVLGDFAMRHPESPMLRASLRPLLKKASGWILSAKG